VLLLRKGFLEHKLLLISFFRCWNTLGVVNVKERWRLRLRLLCNVDICISCCLVIVNLLKILHIIVSLNLSQRWWLDYALLNTFPTEFLGRIVLNHVLQLLRLLHLWSLLWGLAQFRLPTHWDRCSLQERRVVKISVPSTATLVYDILYHILVHIPCSLRSVHNDLGIRKSFQSWTRSLLWLLTLSQCRVSLSNSVSLNSFALD
jgi:hypothetical protein